MKTVGLDMSVTGSGVSVLDDTCQYCVVKTKPADFRDELIRYKYIVERIDKMIGDDVRLVCLEDYFMPRSSRSMGSAMKLVSLGTLMRMRLYERGLPMVTAVPAQLKKWITGKGAGGKDVVMKGVKENLGIVTGNDNEADAIVLSFIARDLVYMVEGKEPPEANEVIKKARKEVLNTIVTKGTSYLFEKVTGSV